MATKPKTQGVVNKGDYRPAPDPKKGPHTKPIYNAADFRPGYFSENAANAKGGKGKAKATKKAKIWHYSRRLAPGATHDAWGNKGVGR